MKPITIVRQYGIRRRTPLRSGRKRSSYAKRERDTEYMLAVKRLPCAVRANYPDSKHGATPCFGRVEADHMGMRAVGRKADDNTCVPLCWRHHHERTDHSGSFKHLTRDELRTWRADAIERTRTEVNRLLARSAA